MKRDQTAPRDYVVGPYLEYQKKYAVELRESDRVLIELTRTIAMRYSDIGVRPRLLDMGCSSGNLLRHLKRILPTLEYHGADLFPEVIERCRADPDLTGIEFSVTDIRDLPALSEFNLIVASAVLFRFPAAEFASICRGICQSLLPGGTLIAFDWYNPFHQSLDMIERSEWHPEGLRLHVRSFSETRATLLAEGFSEVHFHPFNIPIDLAAPDDQTDIRTYTRMTSDGDRLQFRGALFQPWCHLVTHRP